MTEGLRILGDIKDSLNLPIITDIHEPHQHCPWQRSQTSYKSCFCVDKPICSKPLSTNRPLHQEDANMAQLNRHTVEKSRA